MILYSIYDKVAEEFGPIYEAKNDMVASRAYASLVKPEMAHDYELYAVGERVSGDISFVLVPYEPHRKIDVVIRHSADKKVAIVDLVDDLNAIAFGKGGSHE